MQETLIIAIMIASLSLCLTCVCATQSVAHIKDDVSLIESTSLKIRRILLIASMTTYQLIQFILFINDNNVLTISSGGESALKLFHDLTLVMALCCELGNSVERHNKIFHFNHGKRINFFIQFMICMLGLVWVALHYSLDPRNSNVLPPISQSLQRYLSLTSFFLFTLSAACCEFALNILIIRRVLGHQLSLTKTMEWKADYLRKSNSRFYLVLCLCLVFTLSIASISLLGLEELLPRLFSLSFSLYLPLQTICVQSVLNRFRSEVISTPSMKKPQRAVEVQSADIVTPLHSTIDMTTGINGTSATIVLN